MKLREFIHEVVKVSEKSARLARAIRSEQALFSLLVQEKTGEQKNRRFMKDFKTLADVLVQETIKHDLGKKFPQIVKHIYGEENNTFTNTLGESITITVQESIEDTTALLERVLDGDKEAASLLAKGVHEDVMMATDPLADGIGLDLPEDNVGVWIDPIDSTAQYIFGFDSQKAEGGIYQKGLQCVVVLIGAFELSTGLPLFGVVNQPFASQKADSKEWEGRYVWGLCFKGNRTSMVSPLSDGQPEDPLPANSIILSTSVDPEIQSKLENDFKLVFASGAGYKMLCVVDQLVGAYLLTKSSTYKWDTCAPHAILRTLYGGVVDFKKALEIVKSNPGKSFEELAKILDSHQICYTVPESAAASSSAADKWCNAGGILAYRDEKILISILKKLV